MSKANGSDPIVVRRAARLAIVSSIVGIAMPSLLILGVYPGAVGMHPVTALCFILAGIGLFGKAYPAIYPGSSAERPLRGLSALCSVAVMATSGLILLEITTGFDSGIHELLFRDRQLAAGKVDLGHMAPATAVAFLLLGFALCVRDSKNHLIWIGQGASILVTLLGLVAVQSYLFDEVKLYLMSAFAEMALHTSALFVVMGMSTLLVAANKGWMAPFASRYTGGALARRLMPWALVLPILIGWIRWQGEKAGLYETAFGIALLTTANFSILTVVIRRSAKWLNSTDEERARVHKELSLNEERLRIALASASVGTFDYDPITRELFWDDRFRIVVGLPPGAPASQEAFLSSVHPEDRERALSMAQAGLDPNGSGWCRAEYRTVGAEDGRVRYIEAHGQSFFSTIDGERRAVRFIGTVQDVTSRKKAEQHLRRTNDELRQMAYAAAHDLQEPLRNVALSLGYLERSNGARLGPESAELVHESMDSAQRMYRMIISLLQYTQAGERNGVSHTLVDANRVLDDLIRANKEFDRVEIIHEALPTVHMDPRHLEIVLENLIGNSCKFRHAGRRPEIRISAKLVHGAEWLFSVSDNGIGFEPMFAERIFTIFKRLHTRREYPGEGMGLPICARIIYAYGGRIWAQGRPGEGASIFFTLPAQRNQV